MNCEAWKEHLERYADAELSGTETAAFERHLAECASCSVDALHSMQQKRAVQRAGKRFTPSAALRARVQAGLPKQRSRVRLWIGMPQVAAVAAMFLVAVWLTGRWTTAPQAGAIAELADLHVATLASSTPVDVLSTDRHTVKPWFQGKLPFTFNLPELGADSPFTLVGGRMAYLGQSPGAHLIFGIRNHRISVFIFQNRPELEFGGSTLHAQRLTFSVESWTAGDLRYAVIGDASLEDIHSLSGLLKAAAAP